MMSLCLWSVLVLSAVLSTGNGQSNWYILSYHDETQGPQNFTVTCDARRFAAELGNITVTAVRIIKIQLEQRLGNGTFHTRDLWRFSANPRENFDQDNLPEGRTWYVHVGDTRWFINVLNRNSITIEVHDATCQDEGLYTCAVTFIRPDGSYYLKSRGEYLGFELCP